MLLKGAKQRAKKKGRAFTIAAQDILEVWPLGGRCPVLGIVLETGLGKRGEGSPSLDRIDSTKGYEVGNIAVISWRANALKNNGSADEHQKITDWMRENQTGTTEKTEMNFSIDTRDIFEVEMAASTARVILEHRSKLADKVNPAPAPRNIVLDAEGETAPEKVRAPRRKKAQTELPLEDEIIVVTAPVEEAPSGPAASEEETVDALRAMVGLEGGFAKAAALLATLGVRRVTELDESQRAVFIEAARNM